MNRTRKQKNQLCKFLQSAGLSNEEYEDLQGKKNIVEHPPVKKEKIIKKKTIKVLNSLQRMKKGGFQNDKKTEEDGKKEEDIMIEEEMELIPAKCQQPLKLSQIIQKISVTRIEKETILGGCFGHSTIIFRRPVIEGSYYMQFKPLPPIQESNSKFRYQPSIRVGICPNDYLLTIPIGHEISIGLKISSGELITENKVLDIGSTYKDNDVIGMGLKFSPPHKYQDKNEIWRNSRLIFYRNGKEVGEYSEIKQSYYCPGISLFNYANVEVRYYKENMEYLPSDMTSYGDIFNQEIVYEDLKKTVIFSDFVQK